MSLEEQLHEARAEQAELEELLGLRAWTRISSFLKTQAELRTQNILSAPLQSHDAVFEQEFMKGEVQGMLFVAKFVPARVEALEADISMLSKQIAEEHENGTGRERDESDDGIGDGEYGDPDSSHSNDPIRDDANPFGE